MSKICFSPLQKLRVVLGACALVSAMSGAGSADGIAPEVQITGDSGAKRLSVNGQPIEIAAASFRLVGRWGDWMLVAANSGGTGCPTNHHWLDLSATPPALSAAFGACHEALEVEAQLDGSILTRATAPPHVWLTTYRGGSEITTRKVYTFETDSEDNTSPLDFSQSDIGVLFGDRHWGPKILDMLGEDKFELARGYFSGPTQKFEKEGAWWIATGCGRGVCNKVRVVAAVNAETDEVLLAFANPYGKGPLPPAGKVSSPVPPSFSRFLAVSAQSSVLKSAFNGLNVDQRLNLQRRMKELGHYRSAIDGLFGRGTATGLVAMAISTAPEYGVLPNMQNLDGARDLVRRLLHPVIPPLDAAPGSFPFEGEWDCDGSSVTLTSRRYTLGRQGDLEIAEVVELATDIRGVTFTNGYQLAFLNITDHSMTWYSPASTDSFECHRVSGVEPDPIESAEDVADEKKYATDSIVDKKDVLDPAPVAGASLRYPFQGEWSCKEDGATDPLTKLTLTENRVDVAFMGISIEYREVTPIGRNGTAFSVALKDGQMGGIYELDDKSFLLYFSGLFLICER